MRKLIVQTEDELRAEIDFWKKFVAERQDFRNEPVHPRAFEALERAESRLQYVLIDQNRQDESRGSSPLLH